MKRLLAFVLVSAVLLAFGSDSFAKTKPQPKSWTGVLCDSHCSAKMKGDMMKAQGHTKSCMTDEMCAASGYGMMSDGKYYKFDKNGNKLAADWLKGTTRDKDMEVQVTGTLKGNKISVTDLKEKM
ncbi:MAG TPA: hypothetical protein VEW28_01735 [Candidatus Kapabacteria bacterium]|nr:hypothetical protein [Candidatus Kapabacteria bacterium]